MMDRIYSIRIIREEAQALPAFYLKEFSMFCGIYVREYIYGTDETDKTDNQQVDLNIKLAEQGGASQLDAKKEIDISNLVRNFIDLYVEKLRSEYWNTIYDLFQKRLTTLLDLALLKEISVLSDIFSKYDYAYQNYVTHLFLNQLDINRKKKILNNYIDCFNDLFEKTEQLESEKYPYLKFAYLNCSRKINRLCDAINLQRIFDDKIIMEEAHKLSSKYNGFSMGNVLAGLIGLSNRKYWSLGEEYMRKALNAEKKQEHSAFMYYSLGHFYEINQDNRLMAYKQYQTMLDIAPHSYRAIFKRACYLYYQSEKNQACDKFIEVYKQMLGKKDANWMQPLEMEYYYKCVGLLSNSIFQEIAQERQIKIGENEMNEALDSVFTESKFVQALFKDDIQNLHQCFKTKMKSHTFITTLRI